MHCHEKWYPFVMSGTDDYILITSSQNSDDDTSGSDGVVFDEKELSDASRVTMQKQGIFLEKDEEILPRQKPFADFSKEIFEQSGIEILNPEEGDEKDF